MKVDNNGISNIFKNQNGYSNLEQTAKFKANQSNTSNIKISEQGKLFNEISNEIDKVSIVDVDKVNFYKQQIKTNALDILNEAKMPNESFKLAGNILAYEEDLL